MRDRTSRLLAYARLTRIPNVFTALADIALGAFAAGHIDWPSIAFAAGASACFYSAGMVWNDLFDIEQDARERPFRPLPSGAIATNAALRLALALTMLGWGLAYGAGLLAFGFASLLVIAILLYDRWLKRTSAGPIGMGACRFLNVLMGLSAAGSTEINWGLWMHLALIVGLYVVGVTAFARTEASTSRSQALRAGLLIGLAALLLAVPLPLHKPEGTASPLFQFVLVAFGCAIGAPAMRAVASPEPGRVQFAVKRAVLGIIALDAILACAVAGFAGLLILLLLPPALLLGRTVYST